MLKLIVLAVNVVPVNSKVTFTSVLVLSLLTFSLETLKPLTDVTVMLSAVIYIGVLPFKIETTVSTFWSLITTLSFVV